MYPYIYGRRLISRIYKELKKLNKKSIRSYLSIVTCATGVPFRNWSYRLLGSGNIRRGGLVGIGVPQHIFEAGLQVQRFSPLS